MLHGNGWARSTNVIMSNGRPQPQEGCLSSRVGGQAVHAEGHSGRSGLRRAHQEAHSLARAGWQTVLLDFAC